MARVSVFAVSVVAHAALAIGLGAIEVRKLHAATAIEIAETAKKPLPDEAKPPPEPPRPIEQRPERRRAAAPKPADNTPPPETAQQAMADLPDFGLSLSGGVGGDGLAVPLGRPGGALAPVKAAPVRKALAAAATPAVGGCDEPQSKPKPLNVPQPAYTMAARAAGIEGKVRVRLTVDETGRVVDVAVLQGLGHGLDEAALAAARDATFEPALACGKPVRATFTISMRFTAA